MKTDHRTFPEKACDNPSELITGLFRKSPVISFHGCMSEPKQNKILETTLEQKCKQTMKQQQAHNENSKHKKKAAAF